MEYYIYCKILFKIFIPIIMGVPSLYKWLTMRFPSILIHMKREFDYNIDNLYLDFNAIIHPCTNRELKDLDKLNEDLYHNLEAYLDALIAYCKPKKLIYIAIDGVAPKAKMNQQRTRRFRGAKEVYENNIVYLDEHEKYDNPYLEVAFDHNAITPGTIFMEQLDEFISNLIQFKLSTDPLWANKTVIYSNYKVPGEGEQKIMEYLRIHKKNLRESHVIYSPDADLIFLGLTLPNYNIRIMREEVKYKEDTEIPKDRNYLDNHFVLINENKLKNLIIDQLKTGLEDNFNGERLLFDFIFLCFTIGNDFLPSAPCFEIRTNAVEKIAEFLIRAYKRSRTYITDFGGIVNFKALKEFFIECEKDENINLKEKRINLQKSRNRMDLEFNEDVEFEICEEEGKLKYYIEKMDINSEEELMIACKEYIKGMVWIYQYYFFNCPSWDYYYPYYFAPFMFDLMALEVENLYFTPSKPLKPFEQLLCVLPALSMHLLPEPYRKYYYDNKMIKLLVPGELTKNGYIKEYNSIYKTNNNENYNLKDIFEFPDLNFKIDSFHKIMNWQYTAIIPFVNNKNILEYSRKYQNSLTYEEINRNIIGFPVLFTNKDKIIQHHKEIYGKPYVLYNENEYCGKVFMTIDSNFINDIIKTKWFVYKNKVIAFNFDQRYKRK